MGDYVLVRAAGQYIGGFLKLSTETEGATLVGQGGTQQLRRGRPCLGQNLWGCKRNVTPIFHCYLSFLDECQRFCFSLCLALF